MVHGRAMARVQGVDGPLTVGLLHTHCCLGTTVFFGRRHQRFQRPLRLRTFYTSSDAVRPQKCVAVLGRQSYVLALGSRAQEARQLCPEQRSRRIQRWKYRMRRHRRRATALHRLRSSQPSRMRRSPRGQVSLVMVSPSAVKTAAHATEDSDDTPVMHHHTGVLLRTHTGAFSC